MVGIAFDDHILGNSQDNQLTGGPGDDTLEGATGNDSYIYAGRNLGGSTQPAATSANTSALSAEIAAHEIGHLLGLRHQDSFGPIGSGPYFGLRRSFVPDVQAQPNGGPETAQHVLASPDSIGTTLFDSITPTYLRASYSATRTV